MLAKRIGTKVLNLIALKMDGYNNSVIQEHSIEYNEPYLGLNGIVKASHPSEFNQIKSFGYWSGGGINWREVL